MGGLSKRLFYWELAGFLWTGAAGTALHFLYYWTGRAPRAAAVSAVNESVWEHMKLLFVPVFLFTFVQVWTLGRRYPNLLAVRSAAALAGTAAIPLMYYTYTGALGLQIMWVDILIFFLADGGLFWLDFHLLRKGALGGFWRQAAGLLALLALLFAFLWWSYHAPALPLFRG